MTDIITFLWLSLVQFFFGEPEFPQLKGRVVDNANVFSQETAKQLNLKLKQHEERTGNQIVVATISKLPNKSIEDFSYKLARYWKIGQKGKNNGLLLLMVPKKNLLRIEVGYGLESILTDATCSKIIKKYISPYLKNNKYDTAIIKAVDHITEILEDKKVEDRPLSILEFIILLFLICLFLAWTLGYIFISDEGDKKLKYAIKKKTIEKYKHYRKLKNAYNSKNYKLASYSIASIISLLIYIRILKQFYNDKTEYSDDEDDGDSFYNYSSNFNTSSFSGGGGSFGGGGASS